MGDLEAVQKIFEKKDWTKGKYSKHEFQVYGYYLAQQLGDERHASLYIKLAKNTPRGLLQESLTFVKAANAKQPPRLFMWKLKQLRNDQVAAN